MTSGSRRLMLGTFAAAAVVLGGATLAWACTSQAYTYPLQPQFGPPGQVVTVRGGNFRDAPVQIRWNSAEGSLLAVTQGPSFSVEITIPDAAPGYYYVVAIAYEDDGKTVAGKAASPFEVGDQSDSGSQGSQQRPQDPSDEASGEGDGSSSRTRSGSDGSARQTGAGNSSGAATTATEEPSEGRARASRATADEPIARSDGKAQGAPHFPSRAAPGAGVTDAAGPHQAGSYANGQQRARQPWVGPWPEARSLVDDAPVGGSPPGVQLLVGVALLAAGVVGLAVGTFVLEVRRRRAAIVAIRD